MLIDRDRNSLNNPLKCQQLIEFYTINIGIINSLAELTISPNSSMKPPREYETPLVSGGLEMEGGFIFVWSQNIKGFGPDRPGNMKPPLFWRVLRTRGGFILELGLMTFRVQ